MVIMLKQIKKSLNRAKERIKSRLEGRTTTEFKIKHDNIGMGIIWLTIENDSGVDDIKWKDVGFIIAFKRDVFAYDLICFAIGLKDKTIIEINERMENFDSLIDCLPTYLPGCLSMNQWFEKVTIPAFETNLTTIYKQDGITIPKEFQFDVEIN